MKPKISVIIPVYNGELYIERCLESILNQSLKDIQIIVVDDGSEDGTLNVVKKHMSTASNIEFLHLSQNKGTGFARNIGLKHATGEYIAFLDADDWMDTNGYLEMTTALDSSGSNIGVCNIQTEYGWHRHSEIRYQYRFHNTISGNFALRLMCKIEAQDNYISPRVGNKVFRNTFIRRHNLFFPTYPIWEDDLFMFLALFHANKVDLIPGVSEHYFQRESSSMHSFTTEHVDYLISVFSELRSMLPMKNGVLVCEEEYFALLDRCLNTILDNLFNNEPLVTVQRKHICHLIEELLKLFTIQELLAHIDPRRISRLWI